jgi:hypothetical protein
MEEVAKYKRSGRELRVRFFVVEHKLCMPIITLRAYGQIPRAEV